MERKLASIQTVSAIDPIDGADNIELARIEGWQCVVKRAEFKPGDLGVYFEIDSILPEAPWSEFLGDRKRIRTIKLRGALSQGLLLPLSILPDETEGPVTVGDDVTSLLSVTKYERPEPGCAGHGIKGESPDKRADFPGRVPKTDETRLQSALGVLNELRGKRYVITEKVDGSSATFCMVGDEFHACSRNLSLVESESSLPWRISAKYGIRQIIEEHPNLAIQGEMYGPGIQANRLQSKDLQLAVFNVYDKSAPGYLSHGVVSAFCAKYGLPMVRTLEEGNFFDYTLDELLAKAEGKYPCGSEREGIVIRPMVEEYSQRLHGRLSFKVISNKFLLKTGE